MCPAGASQIVAASSTTRIVHVDRSHWESFASARPRLLRARPGLPPPRAARVAVRHWSLNTVHLRADGVLSTHLRYPNAMSSPARRAATSRKRAKFEFSVFIAMHGDLLHVRWQWHILGGLTFEVPPWRRRQCERWLGIPQGITVSFPDPLV